MYSQFMMHGQKNIKLLQLVFKKYDGGAWSGLIWLRIGTGGVLLWTR